MIEVSMKDWMHKTSRELEPGHYVITKYNKKVFTVIVSEYGKVLNPSIGFGYQEPIKVDPKAITRVKVEDSI